MIHLLDLDLSYKKIEKKVLKQVIDQHLKAYIIKKKSPIKNMPVKQYLRFKDLLNISILFMKFKIFEQKFHRDFIKNF